MVEQSRKCLACQKAHLEGANHFLRVPCVYARSRSWIFPHQQPMQEDAASPCGQFVQAPTQTLRAPRTTKQSQKQRAEIESRTADQNWELAATPNGLKCTQTLGAIISGRKGCIRLNQVDEMMWNSCTVGQRKLSSTDVES